MVAEKWPEFGEGAEAKADPNAKGTPQGMGLSVSAHGRPHSTHRQLPPLSPSLPNNLGVRVMRHESGVWHIVCLRD